VHPGDEVSLVAALRRMLTDEPARQQMARRAREQAGELTWERTGRAVMSALQEIAGNALPEAGYKHRVAAQELAG
jgi:glycosyltransferase involved in cell wall biosynthesis